MARFRRAMITAVGLGGLVAACATRAPQLAQGSALQSAGDMANHTAQAGWDTMGQTYSGMGGAVRGPFRDFGLMNKSIPTVLARARADPYDMEGITSCDAVLAEVSMIDAVLGPDLDNPIIKGRGNRYTSGADMAADAALQAAKDAVDHFIPMRGTIRTLSGATRAEAKQHKSELAGNVRRGFLKSVGMAHNCGWPAAPVSFRPAPGGPVWAVVTPASTSASSATMQIAAMAAKPAIGAQSGQRGTSGSPIRIGATVATTSLLTRPQATSGTWRIGSPSDTLVDQIAH